MFGFSQPGYYKTDISLSAVGNRRSLAFGDSFPDELAPMKQKHPAQRRAGCLYSQR